ncbi:MAG: YtxH domain-containing protein [Nitrolancea sp.]
MESDGHQGAFFFGVILGAIAGALAALLVTPKSGPELREELMGQAGDMQQRVTEVTATARERSEGIVGTYVDKVSQIARRESDTDVQVDETTRTAAPAAAEVAPDPVTGETDAPKSE